MAIAPKLMMSRRSFNGWIGRAGIYVGWPFCSNMVRALTADHSGSLNGRYGLLLVVDERIPEEAEATQRRAIERDTPIIVRFRVSNTLDRRALRMAAQQVEALLGELRASVREPIPMTCLTWTAHNPVILELPLKTSADIVIARATGETLARMLMGTNDTHMGKRRAPVEDFVDRMRQDGRPFLVRLDRGSDWRPVDPMTALTG